MTIAKGVGEMMADSAMTTVYAAKEHAGRRINQAKRNTRQKIDKVSGQIKNTEQFRKMEKGLQEKTDKFMKTKQGQKIKEVKGRVGKRFNKMKKDVNEVGEIVTLAGKTAAPIQ